MRILSRSLELQSMILTCSGELLEEMKTLPCDEDGNERFLECELAIRKLMDVYDVIGKVL